MKCVNRLNAVNNIEKNKVPNSTDDKLIHQLYQTMRAFSKTLNNEIYATGVYSSEWSVLKMVKEKGTFSQSELANMLNVEPAAISKTITKMEEKVLVERKKIQGKREKYIFLTPKAENLYCDLEEKVIAHRQKALGNLSEDDKNTLLHLIENINKNLL